LSRASSKRIRLSASLIFATVPVHADASTRLRLAANS
jgi:hypothetical protein